MRLVSGLKMVKVSRFRFSVWGIYLRLIMVVFIDVFLLFGVDRFML